MIDYSKETEAMAMAWQHIAKISSDIAHSRRALFNAYIAEGFTESQALELIKQP